MQAIAVRGQIDYFTLADYKSLRESYFRLSDSIYKAELGSFTFIGKIAGASPEAGLREFAIEAMASDSLLLSLDNTQILIRTGRFSTFRNRLHYIPGHKFLYKINDKPYWGYNGRVPNRQIERISIRIGDHIEEVPHDAFSDLFEPNICRRRRLLFSGEAITCGTRGYTSSDGRRVYLHMTNGYSPLLYEVTFIFKDGRFVGRIVDYSG